MGEEVGGEEAEEGREHIHKHIHIHIHTASISLSPPRSQLLPPE
jgi:hypothetical protein